MRPLESRVYATLFDHIPAPPAPPRKRLRERRHECGLYIRKVTWKRGDLYQVRWWLTGYGSVNCGLYDEVTARAVRKRLAAESAKHALTPLGIWHALRAVLDAMRRTGWAALPEPLPRHVKALPDGGYCALVKKAGRVLECPGPYDAPEAAHLAMCELLKCEFPKMPSKSEVRAELRERERVARLRARVDREQRRYRCGVLYDPRLL